MSNSKANIYPFLILSKDKKIFGVDAQLNTHQLSNHGDAIGITIAEDGTIWGFSSPAERDSLVAHFDPRYNFGSKISWSNGDGNWHEFSSDIPGGLQLSGGPGSSCYFVSHDKKAWKIDTDGSASVYDEANSYEEFVYGGGYMWSVFTNDEYNPRLHYSEANKLEWKAFSGFLHATCISVNQEGDCIGILQDCPVTFAKDGNTSSYLGMGVGDIDGRTSRVSYKDRLCLKSVAFDSEGHFTYVCKDIQEGTFEKLSVRANEIVATYYKES